MKSGWSSAPSRRRPKQGGGSQVSISWPTSCASTRGSRWSTKNAAIARRAHDLGDDALGVVPRVTDTRPRSRQHAGFCPGEYLSPPPTHLALHNPIKSLRPQYHRLHHRHLRPRRRSSSNHHQHRKHHKSPSTFTTHAIMRNHHHTRTSTFQRLCPYSITSIAISVIFTTVAPCTTPLNQHTYS